MDSTDILIIGLVIIGIVAYLLYRYNRKVSKQMYQAQDMIAQNTVTTQIFVIDKKKAKPTPENITKAVYDQMNRTTKMRKMCMVKAKVGPKILTLMCDDPVFEALTPKKNYKVDIAGLYIVGITGANLALKKKKTWKEKLMVAFKRQSKEEVKK